MNLYIKLKIKKLRKSLYKKTIFVEYFRLKRIVLNDNSINKIKKELNSCKKKLVKSSIVSNKDYDINLSNFNSLNNLYNENPLIENYNLVKEEVFNELNYIKEHLIK